MDYEELKNHPLLKNLKVGGSYLTESRKHFDQYYKLINANKLMVYMLSKNNFKNSHDYVIIVRNSIKELKFSEIEKEFIKYFKENE